MSIQRNDSLQIAAPKSIDSRYDGDGSHFTTVGEANLSIDSSFRFQGLTVGILSGGSVTEYWYRDGILDGDLVVKDNNPISFSNISDDDATAPGSITIGNGKVSGGSISLTVDVDEANGSVIIAPKGDGTIQAGGNHEAQISSNADIITKGYFDANLPSGTNPSGSDTELQFNSSGSFGSDSELTWSSNTLKSNNVRIGGGIGSFAGAELQHATQNTVYGNNLESVIQVGISSNGVLGNDKPHVSVYGESHASLPNNIYANVPTGGSHVLTRNGSSVLTVSLDGQNKVDFHNSIVDNVDIVRSDNSRSLTIGPQESSTLMHFQNIPIVSPEAQDYLYYGDFSNSERLAKARVDTVLALATKASNPTFNNVLEGADTTTRIKDINVGTSGATRYFWVNGTAEFIASDASTMTMHIKSNTSAISSFVDGTNEITSVVRGEGASTRAIKTISGVVEAAAGIEYLAIAVTGGGSGVGDVAIFAMELQNHDNAA